MTLCYDAGMGRRARCGLIIVVLLGAFGATGAARELEQRVWVHGPVDASIVTALRAGGITGAVVEVGRGAIGDGTAAFTLQSFADMAPLAPMTISIAVDVTGKGDASGDAAAFWTQLQPAAKLLPSQGSLILAARTLWPGLPRFATELAAASHVRVEVMAPAEQLAKALPPEGWPGLGVVAVALGTPPAAGFPATTTDDDLAAIDALDALGIEYRVAVVVQPLLRPEPGDDPVDLMPLASPSRAAFRRGDHSDFFELRGALSWGGRMLSGGTRVEVEATNAARYNRDLGFLLRPVREGLTGWDVVSLPPPAPAVGMSRQAFLGYLRGNGPYPTAQLQIRWLSTGRLEVALRNPSPFSGTFATTSNWVEVRFSGNEVLDAQLGDFAGLEYGVSGARGWRRVNAAREANAVRLHYTYLGPDAMISGATLSFVSRLRSVQARWAVVPGDGTVVVSDWKSFSR